VPDVDGTLVEDGVPVGNDVIVVVGVLDGAVVVVISTHAMMPTVT
jgi:hypothetical protein